MARIPYGMRVLIEAIHEAFPPGDVVTSPSDEDGIGVYRSLLIDEATADKMGTDVLDLISQDERVQSIEEYGSGVVITFVADSRADSKGAWSLAQVVRILQESSGRHAAEEEVSLEPIKGARLIRCPVCYEAISTDGTYTELTHHEDGSHTAMTEEQSDDQTG